MSRSTDIRPVAAALYFLPIRTRMPLKFGAETLDSVTLARVTVTVADRARAQGEGWGETPLSVQWVWPSASALRGAASGAQAFCEYLTVFWGEMLAEEEPAHPMELGQRVLDVFLEPMREKFNREERAGREPMPHLAALVCASAFDIATHDAYGVLHGVPTYETYNGRWMNRDLATLPGAGGGFGRVVRGALSGGFSGHRRAR